MDGIKPHCMGTAFPKRGAGALGQLVSAYIDSINDPTAADLDAVAEEQRVKENTSRKP
jgi:hypothetical protein